MLKRHFYLIKNLVHGWLTGPDVLQTDCFVYLYGQLLGKNYMRERKVWERKQKNAKNVCLHLSNKHGKKHKINMYKVMNNRIFFAYCIG